MPKALTAWRPPRARAPSQKERKHYTSADWRAKRERILVRDSFRCASCGMIASGQAAHVDHVRPLEEGGTDADENLQTLCSSCHGRKTIAEQRRRGEMGKRT